MTLVDAIEWTQRLMGLAFLLQGFEHLSRPGSERVLFGIRLPFCLLLILGIGGPWVLLPLLITTTAALLRFRGPYNGGADRLGTLMLLCLIGAEFAPWTGLREVAMGYLAIQVTLSYAMAGWVKLKNPDWWTGKALRDLFAISAYPVSEALRALSAKQGLLKVAGWVTILFESLFPLVLLRPESTLLGLMLAGGFHLMNALCFGLNRFFWVWIASYPTLLWFQGRITPP